MGDPLLSIERLSAGYRTGLPILHEVSLTATRGQIVALIGPNGAGKSTLIKAIAGFLRILSGSVRLDGRDITSIRPDTLSFHGMSYVPQTANVFTTLTVRQNLVLSAQRCRDGGPSRIAHMFELFPDLLEREAVRAGGLSGGQRQMLAIAMALITEPALLLMDEPTAGLSPKVAQDVLGLITDIAATGTCVILVEQNARAALRISDRAYVLAEGRVCHEGTGQGLLQDPELARIFLGVRGADA